LLNIWLDDNIALKIWLDDHIDGIIWLDNNINEIIWWDDNRTFVIFTWLVSNLLNIIYCPDRGVLEQLVWATLIDVGTI
jgi:hypothetical protein